MAEKAKDKALQLTSGRMTYREMRRRNHPYGRGSSNARGPRGTAPLLPIHRHTGQLQRSIRVIPQRGGTEWRVQFTSPHAIAVRPGGSANVRARGFWTAMRKYVEPINRRSLLAAKRAAERG